MALIGPQTEADEAALLVQFLTFYGNCVGASPYYEVEATRHRANLFTLVVGNTAKGRKGTSEAHVRRIFNIADKDWAEKRTFSGLSTGEGIIAKVCDPRTIRGRNGKDEQVPGAEDKRLLVVESEFGKALSVMSRDGNTLSAILREAWDGRRMQVLTRTDPETATDAHISLIGHITSTELRQKMHACEAFNGFGNRILWTCSQRARELPFGGEVDQPELHALADAVQESLTFARKTARVVMDDAAREFWPEVYSRLTKDRPGLAGALTGRAEAQVMRLALIYALLASRDRIGREHLEAALEVWRYCDDSARWLFGDALGDATADRIRSELQQEPDGLSRNEIREKVFRKNKTSQEVSRALEMLQSHGMVRMETVQRLGRPEERWFATTGVTPAPGPSAATR